MENKRDVLRLIRFNGEEQYPIIRATWSIYYDDELKKNDLCILAEAGEGIVLNEDTKGSNVSPCWKLNYIADGFDKDSLKPGFSVTIPEGYVEAKSGYITSFYYYEDQETNNNTIEIIAVENDRLKLRVTGEGVDINDYDNSKPPCKIIIETWFQYDDETTRYNENNSAGGVFENILSGILDGVLNP